jgi:hypothetical protein
MTRTAEEMSMIHQALGHFSTIFNIHASLIAAWRRGSFKALLHDQI